MTTERFVEVFHDRDLRQFIITEAKKRNHHREIQEDFIQEAWLIISTAPDDYSIEALKGLAWRAIYSAYWQEYKEYQELREYREFLRRFCNLRY